MTVRTVLLALVIGIAAGLAACAQGAGLIPRKGGGDGPVHCHGARC